MEQRTTASWQAHVLTWYLKLFLKPRLKGQRDVARIRKLLQAPPFGLPRGVRATPGIVGGVSGEWMETNDFRGSLLYIHGGGYIGCSSETHRPITAFFAQQGLRVFTPDYRLAPEHPFPAAVHDVIEVFLAMAEDSPYPVGLAGDSAGGGLALSMMLALRAAGRNLPKAAALFSPWTDLAITGESVVSNAARCSMFSGADMPFVASLYLGATPANDPIASPLYGDLAKLPPLLIHVGADETLLDDSTRLAQRARDFGVSVQLRIWPVVPHGWHLTSIPEAHQSLREAAAFLAAC